MAKSGYRVTLGDDPKFTPAKEDKMAFSSVRLAEDSWSFDQGTGEYVRGETTWYDGQFFGKDAEALHEQFQKGDKIIVLGRVVEESVTRNGTEYQNTHLRVDTFGPDMKHANVSIDRAPRATTAPAQNVPQQQATQPKTQADWRGQVQNVMAAPRGSCGRGSGCRVSGRSVLRIEPTRADPDPDSVNEVLTVIT